MAVTIAGVRVTPKEDGEEMISLELEGGLEIVTSKSTGLPYAKVKRTLILATFEKETAENMVGTTLPGEIKRVPCEPYTWINKETGEETVLNHTYLYQADIETVVQELDFALEEEA